MPEALAATLALPGVGWMAVTIFLAGVVYGFAGFGAALIFMPVAVIFIPPAAAIPAFSVAALASVVTVLPRALPQINRRAVGVMLIFATVAAWGGIWALRHTDVTAIRWAVVIVALVTLAALVSGWRYSVEPSMRIRAVIGALTGFVGGLTGLVGPIMVMFQLAGRDGAAVSRATAVVFLTTSSVLLLPIMAAQGILTGAAILLGLVLLVPYGLGCRVGQALFDPARERLYRAVAYGIIGLSALAGLPIWN